MKCWICRREARGFGHTDGRHGVDDPRRYPTDWVFCSRRCQDAFRSVYGQWLLAKEGAASPEEVSVIDPTDIERAAMRRCLRFFGEAAAEIGFAKPLGEYSEAQALQVIEAIVTAYTEAMVEHHEATKYPPVRGLAPQPDPMAIAFDDMPDDRPWEQPVHTRQGSRK